MLIKAIKDICPRLLFIIIYDDNNKNNKNDILYSHEYHWTHMWHNYNRNNIEQLVSNVLHFQ